MIGDGKLSPPDVDRDNCVGELGVVKPGIILVLTEINMRTEDFSIIVLTCISILKRYFIGLVSILCVPISISVTDIFRIYMQLIPYTREATLSRQLAQSSKSMKFHI